MIMQQFLYRLLRRALSFGSLAIIVLGMSSAGYAAGQRILVLGDSISAAYGMSLEQGWVALMEAELRGGGHQVDVINASISGETTGGGLRRLPPLLEEHQPELVVIELGGNDGLRGYPLNRLRANLDKLVEMSLDAGAGVLLLPMEIPPNYGSRYTDGFRESFQVVARERQVDLGPFILDGVATDPDYMQADGIHPSVQAQPRLLQNVLPSITEALEKV